MTPQQEELSPEATKAIGVIEKLLRLAARNPNQAEAESAQAKAMELMTAFNLDMATVEENSGESGKRADEKLKGGHYQYQRDLWQSVAELNFCLYFSVTAVERFKKGMVAKDPRQPHLGFKRAWGEKRVRQHRVVGRTVNTRATRVMAEYLEQTIERLTRERLKEQAMGWGELEATGLSRSQLYGTWANSFREGMAEAICKKIYERRRHMLSEERRKRQEAEDKAREQGFEGTSTGTAITIAGLTQSEHDANMELLHPGYIARKAAQKAADEAWNRERAERRQREAEAQAAAEAAYARWAAANPIEARLQEEKARKEEERERKREERNERRRTGPRQSYGRQYKGDWGARRAGYEVGDTVSIDQQTGSSKVAGALS